MTPALSPALAGGSSGGNYAAAHTAFSQYEAARRERFAAMMRPILVEAAINAVAATGGMTAEEIARTREVNGV